MKLKDFTLKVDDDVAFWDMFLRFRSSYAISDKKDVPHLPLGDEQRAIYALALSLPYEEPFSGHAREEMATLTGKSVASIDMFKTAFKKKGWLKKDGSYPSEILSLKRQYAKESQDGIKSLTFIYKVCVC